MANKKDDYLTDDELHDDILEEDELNDDELPGYEPEKEEDNDPITVKEFTGDDGEEKIRVEHEDGRFVEGLAYPDFFSDRYMRTMVTPPKVRVKGKKDTIAYLNNRYSPETDQTLYILKRMLTAWSEDKKITEDNILKSRKLNVLFYRFVDKFKEVNDMAVEDDEEKN